MIIAFPGQCWEFIANQDIPKGKQARPAGSIGFPLIATAPINIHINDSLIVDIRTGKVEIVLREGIAVYREAWKN